MKVLLEKLTIPVGVSGHEADIRSTIEDLRPAEYESSTDHIGNLVWRKDKAVKVMFTAHMDEIGVIVSGYDDCKLKFAAVGGIDSRSLPNTTLLFENGKNGVIGLPAPHIAKDRDKVLSIEELRIDTGYTTEEEVKEHFPIGTTGVVISPSFTVGDTFFSRNTDNRAGCATLIKLAHRLRSVRGVAFAFLVREEIGLQGARAMINESINAKAIINMDVTVREDGMGDGAIVSLKDGGYMADLSLVEAFKDVGAEVFEVSTGGTSDHAVGQLYAKTLGISFPSAYIHSSVSKVNLKDLDNAVDLCEKYVLNTIK